MQIVKGGITKPKGFKACGLSCGIKRSGKPDLALIYSTVPAVASAVFTKNSIKAAPVIISKRHIRNNKAQAIVVNSGNANCFTGEIGLIYAEQTAILAGKLLNIPPKNIIVSSTGIIGKPFPYKKIQEALPKLINNLSDKEDGNVAKAILTTDKKTKEITVCVTLDGKKITIGTCAKGSGMISPDMATMLAFITTDAAISPGMLKLALKKATDKSFNCITIDGCMSTNDMVVIMANSLAGNKIIRETGEDFDIFYQALEYACIGLAKKIVLDGEGATKFIEINVRGARNEKQAKNIGLTIANSNLVKTAAYGNNPNWGRVAAAVGSLKISKITEETMEIKFSPFTKKEIIITVSLYIGGGNATVYTSDLSEEYIKINGKYN